MNFIAVGQDGKSRHLIGLVTTDDMQEPTTGVGLVLYELANGRTQEYGAAVEDVAKDDAIYLGGIWYFDERAIDIQIKMLEAAKKSFKREDLKEEDET